MDFMSDQRYSDRILRFLTLVDNLNRESLTLWTGKRVNIGQKTQRLPGDDVVQVLERVKHQHYAFADTIQADTVSELTTPSLN